MWPKYLPPARFAYNTFNIPYLGHYTPNELHFGRKRGLLINLDSDFDVKVSGTFREYERLKYLHEILLNFKSKRLAMTELPSI